MNYMTTFLILLVGGSIAVAVLPWIVAIITKQITKLITKPFKKQ